LDINETTCFGLLGGHYQVLQSSKKLNIFCVWRMLRSHHLAYKLYRVSHSLPNPTISLIILTPMKIFQRHLNRSTFVVWEMKRNMSVVCVC